MRVPLGRWRTDRSGHFLWVDVALWDLLDLPLVPIGSIGWDDLVLPGTDLGFLDHPPFTKQRVVVGVAGTTRCWELSGSVLRAGGELDGLVEEVDVPPGDGADR